jgi:GTPase SAR1 family protein
MATQYKLIILAPAAGGKSTLMRLLRAQTDLVIAEIDEEILKANDNVWPQNREYKENVIVPAISKEILEKSSVIYFSYTFPPDLLKEAKKKGFKTALLDVGIEELKRRNIKRMAEEGYDDISHWFELQLKNFNDLKKRGLIGKVIDGHQPPEQIAKEIIALSKT